MSGKRLWHDIRPGPDLDQYYYRQDGEIPHCSQNCLSFLDEKFNGRLISRKVHPWPLAQIPDLSSIDFRLWERVQQVLYV